MDNVQQSINTRDVHFLYQCSKDELYEIAEKYQITVRSQVKSDMQREIIKALTEVDILPSSGLPGVQDEKSGVEDMELSEKVALEKVRQEHELKRLQVQANKEVELKKLEMGVSSSLKKEKDYRVYVHAS